MSECESAKGSADCLPKVSYQSSSSIVRLSGTNNSADEISGESAGKWNSTLPLRAEYLVSVFPVTSFKVLILQGVFVFVLY